MSSNEGDRVDLRDELARLNIHILTAGDLMLMVLMPVFHYGDTASRSGPVLLTATYALEAAIAFLLAFWRSWARDRMLRLWMSTKLVRALNGVLRRTE